MIEINLQVLTDEQLVALRAAGIVPAEVIAPEVERRKAAPTLAEGLADLALASARLYHPLSNMRATQAVQAVLDSGIIEAVNRLIARARLDGTSVPTPKMEDITNGEA